MNDAALAEHNEKKLCEMDREFARRVRLILAFMRSKGHRCRIVTGWRSPAEQARKVAQGFSKAKFGFHNVVDPATGAPRALAADIVSDDNPYKEGRVFYQQLYRAALDTGLQTGIVYGLDEYQLQFLVEAVRAGRYDYAGEIGWDPTHVEPSLLTITQAKRGMALPPGPC